MDIERGQPMILVAGTVKIRADKRAEAVAHALRMTEATEAEPGCRTYRFYSEVGDPLTFLIFEAWESAAALEAHFQQPHTAEFSARLSDWVAAQPSVWRYDVSGAQQIM